MFQRKTVGSVTAKLTKIAADLREVEEQAKADVEEASKLLAEAAVELQMAGKVAGNIEALLQ